MKFSTVWCSAGLALAVTFSFGCDRKAAAPPMAQPELPTAEVQVSNAESKEQMIQEEVIGTVRAKLRATLEAKVSGRIEEMPVVLGQTVKSGQLVARLHAAEARARLDQAKATLQQSDRDWKRLSALFTQQAVSRSEYDAAESRLQIAKASATEAEAILSYVEVLAPFDGVVSKKWLDQGDLAAPGKALIDIEDPSALLVEADVPEALFSKILPEAHLKILLDSPKTELLGTVAEIAPAADPMSRTFRVKVTLPPATNLMSGQFARLLVPVGQSRSVRVPAPAVVVRGQLEMVFVITNQRAQLHLVKTGKNFGDEVEILAGIEAGESIAVGGAALLSDGQAVNVK